MQKAFLKLAFVSSVFATMSFAGGTDLLSLATDGAVTTAKADMVGVKVLSSDEMGDVKGGYTFIPTTYNRYYGSTGTLYNSYSGVGSSYYSSNTRSVYTPTTTNSSIYASSFGSSYWGRTYPGASRR